MNINKAVLMCAIFVGGTVVGAVGNRALNPKPVQTFDSNGPSTSTPSITADAEQITSGGERTSPSVPSAAQLAGAAADNVNHYSAEWQSVNDRSGYRVQLNTLNQIASASESELLEIITDIEKDTQRFYQKGWVYRAAVQRWAEMDSQAVVAHLEQLYDGNKMSSSDNLVELVRALALVDFDVMLQWLDNLDPQQYKYQFISSQAYSVLAELNPTAALERAIQTSSANGHQQQSIEQVVMQWASEDPQAALAWIEQNPNRVNGSHVKEMAMMSLMYSDPQAGLAMLSSIENPQRRMDMES